MIAVDVLIIGGGLTGAALLLALKDQGFKTLLIEKTAFCQNKSADFDARTLALSQSSVKIMETLGLWQSLIPAATPIKTIHISEQGHFGSARLQDKNALGFVVEVEALSQTLYSLLNPKELKVGAHLTALDIHSGLATIQWQDQTLRVQSKLIVAADGADSTVRQLSKLSAAISEYGQEALVANIGLKRHHHNQAYERFTTLGSLGLLPMSHQRMSLVWALKSLDAKRLLAEPEAVFLQTLHKCIGYRLGRLEKVGRRTIFPLRQVILQNPAPWPLVFIGNAAQSLHPIAGQGFNLGLRDVATLAQCLVKHGLHANMLQQYHNMRRYDQKAITHFTNFLLRSFTNKISPLQGLRALSLMAIDNMPLLQKLVTHHAGGFAGLVPDLVCGIPLGEAFDARCL